MGYFFQQQFQQHLTQILYKLRGEIQVKIQGKVNKNTEYNILTKTFLYNFEIYYLTEQRCYTLLFTDFIYCYFEVLL